jgi:tetratricopeptide (TPR) repeat protein
MTKALDFVRRSQESDPDFCRVQFQYAHIYLRQNKHKKMEFHLTRAIHCPTSSSQAYQLWTKYWQAQPDKEKARKRQEKLLTDYEKEKQEAAEALELEQMMKRMKRGDEL